MPRRAVIAGLATLLLLTTPAFAVTAKDKMATCKFGADDQKLQGKAREAFLAKCMANKDDPRGSPAPAGARPKN